MGAALSTACSSLFSYCSQALNWISSCCLGGGGMSSDKENQIVNDTDIVVRGRGLNSDEEQGVVVKGRGLDLTEPEEDPASSLGDIWNAKTAAQAYKEGKIRSMAPTESHPLKVTFTNHSGTSELILCWISPNGDLHHYYRLPPNGGSHLEHTKTGDAFCLFQAPPPPPPPGEDDTKRGDEEDEENASFVPVCNQDNIVAAYRPKDTEESNHHYVALDQAETIVASQGGFLRGSTKKQKVLQWTIQVTPQQKPDEPKPDKPKIPIVDTTNKHYEKKQYGDWTVYCEPGCWDPTVQVGTKMGKGGESKEHDAPSIHDVFQADLKALSQRLPAHVRPVLCQSTALYMNTTHTYAQQIDNPVGCFHPGRDWLEQHKMNPNKCGQVEFYNVSNYADHRRLWGTGGIILHEFCHAYHNKHLPDGYDNQEIIDCYQAAMDEGLYDQCNYHACYVGGKPKEDNDDSPFGETKQQEQCQPEYEVRTTKHYACSNPMEYFAELSVAFLASPEDDIPQEEYNKWYPHNAKQLKEHDPRAFALLQKLWGVDRS